MQVQSNRAPADERFSISRQWIDPGIQEIPGRESTTIAGARLMEERGHSLRRCG
ncbi:hypothetical protein WMO13_09480 [Ignatzschineria larvae DSM 13226]|uniref:Uncharacterized protein n=1 Tax=Ignatzschineria larvae DSM 13226 TaxID=1111732 RepID=A0ABZ3C0D5_9GAMM